MLGQKPNRENRFLKKAIIWELKVICENAGTVAVVLASIDADDVADEDATVCSMRPTARLKEPSVLLGEPPLMNDAACMDALPLDVATLISMVPPGGIDFVIVSSCTWPLLSVTIWTVALPPPPSFELMIFCTYAEDCADPFVTTPPWSTTFPPVEEYEEVFVIMIAAIIGAI